MANSIHIIADFFNCPIDLLNNGVDGEKVLARTVKESGLSCILIRYHQFEPAGYTAAALLAESHMTIHTWPEHNSAQIDIFTCGSHERAEKAYEVLKRILEPQKISQKILLRSLDKIEEKMPADLEAD
jgi:S-adenosylmethionine decarboxylase